MAIRRRQQVSQPLSVSVTDDDSSSSSSSSASSLAAKAIRASSAHRDFSLSSAYGESAVSSPRELNPLRSSSLDYSTKKDSSNYGYTSTKSFNEPKQGFWGALARKAKAIIDDDDDNEGQQPHETAGRTRTQQVPDTTKRDQLYGAKQLPESQRKAEGHKLQKGLDAIASSLNYIGGTIGSALEEGLQETRKLQIKRRGSTSVQNQDSNVSGLRQQPAMRNHMQTQAQTDLETQLKASRDVAMAMAAKAKLLLRELKTVKADLAFAKERCAQLEEENRILRTSREKSGNPEDDDLIRLQLETLLAEKARLAQDNSVLTRENRFLREIVEYHQLTMQDVVYLDENSEEVTEVYPIKVTTPQLNSDLLPHPVPPPELTDASPGVTPYVPTPMKNGFERHSKSFS